MFVPAPANVAELRFLPCHRPQYERRTLSRIIAGPSVSGNLRCKALLCSAHVRPLAQCRARRLVRRCRTRRSLCHSSRPLVSAPDTTRVSLTLHAQPASCGWASCRRRSLRSVTGWQRVPLCNHRIGGIPNTDQSVNVPPAHLRGQASVPNSRHPQSKVAVGWNVCSADCAQGYPLDKDLSGPRVVTATGSVHCHIRAEQNPRLVHRHLFLTRCIEERVSTRCAVWSTISRRVLWQCASCELSLPAFPAAMADALHADLNPVLSGGASRMNSPTCGCVQCGSPQSRASPERDPRP